VSICRKSIYRKLWVLLLVAGLSACAVQREEAAVLEEPAELASDIMPCPTGDDDGIGGTGCSVGRLAFR